MKNEETNQAAQSQKTLQKWGLLLTIKVYATEASFCPNDFLVLSSGQLAW